MVSLENAFDKLVPISVDAGPGRGFKIVADATNLARSHAVG
jgi:hypothetical protein